MYLAIIYYYLNLLTRPYGSSSYLQAWWSSFVKAWKLTSRFLLRILYPLASYFVGCLSRFCGRLRVSSVDCQTAANLGCLVGICTLFENRSGFVCVSLYVKTLSINIFVLGSRTTRWEKMYMYILFVCILMCYKLSIVILPWALIY